MPAILVDPYRGTNRRSLSTGGPDRMPALGQDHGTLSQCQSHRDTSVKTVMGVIGTRPEAIKMAPVVLEARRRGRFRFVLCATGQHKDMLYHGLEPFDLTPDIDLGLMQYDQTLPGLTSRPLTSITDCVTERPPDAGPVQRNT